jgi:hypothetical protein
LELEAFQQHLLRIYEFQCANPVTILEEEEQTFTKSIHRHLQKVAPEEKARRKEEKEKARLFELAKQWPELAKQISK